MSFPVKKCSIYVPLTNIAPDRHSMKSVFLVLTSLLAISTAHAEDAPQGCAPVEGT